MLSYKTKFANKENRTINWYLIDAEGEIVGRIASEVAKMLRGKNKTDFTPHFNSGDKVVVINADKVRFTGNKLAEKVYKRYTGYPDGLKTRGAAEQLRRKPTEVLKHAVEGMLPKNKLQKVYMKNLYLYVGTEHPHVAQNPVKIEI
jgi:large subunit ribosomal protein L13